MIKYSVKKPFTVLVAVIIVLVIGFVSLSGMKTDLLPEMNMPYMMVITTYPGASPEKVEESVTKPWHHKRGGKCHQYQCGKLFHGDFGVCGGYQHGLCHGKSFLGGKPA